MHSSIKPYETINIELDEESLEVTASGLVLGSLVVRVNGGVHPDEKWQDFVQIVLSWWVAAVRNLSNSNQEYAVLNFMDGPFKIILDKRGSEKLWQFSFTKDIQNHTETLYTGLIEPYEFMVTVTQAANKLVRTCISKGILTEDGESLNEELICMQKYLNTINKAHH